MEWEINTANIRNQETIYTKYCSVSEESKLRNKSVTSKSINKTQQKLKIKIPNSSFTKLTSLIVYNTSEVNSKRKLKNY